MFGLSIGEVVLIVGVGTWALGPKELPRLAKTLGRVTGKAAGFVYKTRTKAAAFAEQNELRELHQELQATVQQLNAIRSELQGGLLNPGPLAQTLIRASQLGEKSTTVLKTPDSVNNNSPSQSSSRSSSLNNHSFASDPLLDQQQQQQELYSLSNGSIARNATRGLVGEPALKTTTAAVGNATHPPQSQATQPTSVNTHSTTNTRASNTAPRSPPPATHAEPVEIPESLLPHYIPVSAVLAGLAPDRGTSTPTGAEVMMDAVQEEMMAAQARQFMKSQQGGGA